MAPTSKMGPRTVDGYFANIAGGLSMVVFTSSGSLQAPSCRSMESVRRSYPPLSALLLTALDF